MVRRKPTRATSSDAAEGGSGKLDMLRVVGIGSSAGGLEALSEMLSTLVAGVSNAGVGNAYVIAQHLAPDHSSELVALLQRTTTLHVVEAVDGVLLRPNEVFVGPPNRDMVVDGDHLRVFEPSERVSPSPSIDVLFKSIAAQHGPNGVGVVLSGTGSDGALGIRSIRTAGGITMVQDPETARFDAMPRAASALGLPDLVMSPNEIGRRLGSLSPDDLKKLGESLPTPEPDGIAAVAKQVRRISGVDFSLYKQSTLGRQVQRRMALRQVESIADYVQLLHAEPGEAEALTRQLLISVTSFFRDPAAFAALRDRFATYVTERPDLIQLRVWVAGCATGEEAYSIAMVCSDVLGNPVDLERRLKVFATDLDDAALGVARRGLYPQAAFESVPAEMVAMHTNGIATDVEISSRLRSCLVFAHHNVFQDPPFPHIDLVSCRNTMIYFTAPLQRQVLELFRYSLAPGGILLLGSSETIGSSVAGLETLDPEHRIYASVAPKAQHVARPTVRQAQQRFSVALPALPSRAARHDAGHEQRVQLLDSVVHALAPASLLLDENHELVEVIGDVSSFCRIPAGPMPTAAKLFLHPDLRAEARALLLLARADVASVTGNPVRLEDVDPPVTVQMEARPVKLRSTILLLLSFVSIDEREPSVVPERNARLDAELERLERELIASQAAGRTALVDLESLNEELEALNEELQASSEELQSTNEELEASNEELQATNEELIGLNEQLRRVSYEQERLNLDLENIQLSSNQGMVMVDADRRVIRFTPLAVRVFALVQTDIGSRLGTMMTTTPIPGLDEAIGDVIAGGPRAVIEVFADEISLLVQVLPYNDRQSRRMGAIITLTDVSDIVAVRGQVAAAAEELLRVTNALPAVVWQRDLTLNRLLYLSDYVLELTGWSAAELSADASLVDAWIVPEDLGRVQEARLTATWQVEYRITTRGGEERWVLESGTVYITGAGRHAVGTTTDITARIRAEQHASDLALIFAAVYEAQSFGVAVLDENAMVVMANPAFTSMLGYEQHTAIGLPMRSFLHPDARVTDVDFFARLEDGDGRNPSTHHLVRRDGASRWVTVDFRRLPRVVGTSAGIAIVQDVTELYDSMQLLTREAQYDESVTGLLNRTYFRAALDQAVERCADDGIVVLLWLDLDRFKEVNDQHGHSVGDEVLKTIAHRVVSAVRPGDVVGRLGGDEFGILMAGPADSLGVLESLLARLLAVLREPVAAGDSLVSVSGSLGYAVYPADVSVGDGLMRAADEAMYSVKAASGDNAARYTASMNAAAEEIRVMRQALAAAIAAEQFELFYQPIVAATGREVWGAESLVRWHRDGSVVPAAEFIDFLERSGQIRQLGPLTFSLLRRDLDRLRTLGHGGVRVSINMSVTQLEDPAFAERLNSWPSSRGLDGLVVEVVESVFLPDSVRAMDTLMKLVQQGAEISIDDYGSGFSNLRLLKDLSPSYIKMDRSLIEMHGDPTRYRTLLASAVQLSHALGATVIAEGVETSEQWALAAELGSDFVQGYLIARPMPLDELAAWLTNRSAAG